MKKFLQNNIFIVSLLLSVAVAQAQSISPHLIGTNAWLPPWMGSQINQLWDDIGDAGFQLVRIGGNGAQDANAYTPQRVADLIVQIRATGADVIVQVPRSHTAAQTTALITYINGTRGLNVRYWAPGNEPNLSNSNHTPIPVSQVAAYIRTISGALKAYDPTIKIIGPTTAWYDTNYFNPLFVNSGPDNIAGKNEAGHYYIDILSWNKYGISAGAEYESTINSALNIINNINNTRPEENKMSWAITEFNSHYSNDIANSAQKVWSFNAGQTFAEMYDIGMRKGAFAICGWSIFESGGGRINGDLGLFDLFNGQLRGRSIYYHSLMLGRHMKSEYIPGTKNQSSVSISAMGDEKGFSVMILNRNKTNTFNYSLSFNGTYGSSAALRISINRGLEKEITSTIDPVTTQMLVFDAEGNLTRKYNYSESHSLNYIGPSVTDFSSPGAATGSLIFTRPMHGDKLKTTDDLVVEVEAVHPIGIDSVSLSLNNKLIATLSTAPFIWDESHSLPDSLTPGFYDLKSIAYLSSGDSIITYSSFYVILSFAPPEPIILPGTVQAELFSDMFGIQTEPTSDVNGGLNVGYLDVGDWLEYDVSVARAGEYIAVFRVAGWQTTGKVALRNAAGINLTTVAVPNSGGYQQWRSIAGASKFNLNAGVQKLRIHVEGSPFNINYFEIKDAVFSPVDVTASSDVKIYPVPVSNLLHVKGIESYTHISLINNLGQKVIDLPLENRSESTFDVSHLQSGIYILNLYKGVAKNTFKIVVND